MNSKLFNRLLLLGFLLHLSGNVISQDGLSSCVQVQLSVFLEGPYNTDLGEMANQLNLLDGDIYHRGVLPGQRPINYNLPLVQATPIGQPYNTAPWFYNGQEGSFDSPPWYFATDSSISQGDTTYAAYHEDVVDLSLIHI